MLASQRAMLARQGRAGAALSDEKLGAVFAGIGYAVFAWVALLLLAGIRAVHGWTWARAAAATAASVALPVLLVAAAKL